MKYILKPTLFFLEQLDNLSLKSRRILKEKIELLKRNPSRNKRIFGYNLFLFRIRFSDSKKEKRAIYLLEKNEIKLLCVLDRENNYKDLKKYLTKLGLL